ncbi:MAG: hypothetical protein U0807_03465 [Candidatus Binatia bacterium]
MLDKLIVTVPKQTEPPPAPDFSEVAEIKLRMAEGDFEGARSVRAAMLRRLTSTGALATYDPRGRRPAVETFVAVDPAALSPAGQQLLDALRQYAADYRLAATDIGERSRIVDALASALKLNVDTVERQQIAHGVWP